MSYQPREGSKTAAAAEYLRSVGGQATAAQLADAIETEQKQFTGLFGPAIEHGFLAEITINGKKGYRLLDSAPETKAEAAARALHVSKVIPARRSTLPIFFPPAIVPGGAETPDPGAATKPEPKKKTVRQMARSLKIESFADATPTTPPPRSHRAGAGAALPRRAVLGRHAAPGGRRGGPLHGAVRGHRLHRRNAIQGSRRQAGRLPGCAVRI